MPDTPAPAAPIFPAEREPRLPWILVAFIGLSLFAHAATFFLFQVIYPQRVTLPPPAPHVALLTPDTPEQEALLRWVAAEDPALVAASAGAEPPGLLELAYRPSFATLRTPPRTPAAEPVRPERPPSPLWLDFGAENAPPQAVSPRAWVGTRIQLFGALAGRRVSPEGRPQVRAAASLQPAQFLLALNDRGEPRFTFLQQSSGDEAADAAAAVWLSQAHYSEAAEPMAWGVASVVWGDDVYVARAPSNP